MPSCESLPVTDRPRPFEAPFAVPVTVLLVLTALFWAGNAIAGQLAVGHVLPFQLVFLRWIMVAGALWALYGREVRAHWPVIRPRLASLVLLSFVGFTAFNILFLPSRFDIGKCFEKCGDFLSKCRAIHSASVHSHQS